jgi:hypothetical protein
VDPFRQAVEQGGAQLAVPAAAFQPGSDEGCEGGGFGGAEAEAGFGAGDAVQQDRRRHR